MKVPTVNLFLTFDVNIVNDLFFSRFKKTLSDVMKESNKGINSILISNTANSELISLSHSAPDNIISIELLDPRRLLELKVIRSGIPIPDIDSELFQRIHDEEKALLQENKERSLHWLGRNTPLITDLSGISPFDTNYIKKYLETYGSRKVYVSYGIGSDISTWAGPFVCSIGKILFSGELSQGRRFLLELVATDSLLNFNNVYTAKNVEFNMLGLDTICEGYCDLDLGEKTIGKETGRLLPSISDQITKYVNQVKESENEFFSYLYEKDNIAEVDIKLPISIHHIITTCLREYLEAITNIKKGNIIILLPELDVVNKSIISNAIKTKGNINIDLLLEHDLTTFNFIRDILHGIYGEVLSSYGILYPARRMPKGIEKEFKYSSNYHVKILSALKFQKSLTITPSSLNLAVMSNRATQDQVRSFERDGLIREYNSYFAPIKKLQETISKSDVLGGITSFLSFYENDINVLKLFKKHGLIESDTIPAFIFGTENLISTVLYGEASLGNIEALRSNSFLSVDDVDKFTKLDYLKEIKKLSNTESGEYEFNKLGSIPDELSLIGEPTFSTEEFSTRVKEDKIPVFTSNIKNSNVISYTFDDYNYFNSLLQKEVLKQLQFAATQSVNPSSEAYSYSYITNEKDLLEYFKNTLIKNYKDPKSNDPLIKSIFTKLAKPVDFINAIVTRLLSLQGKNRPKLLMHEELGMDDRALQNHIAREMQKVSFDLKLRTLPYFTKTKLGHVGKTCVFINVMPKYMGTKDYKPVDTILTGLYQIKSFKHYFDNNSVYSEYTLQKNIHKNPLNKDVNPETPK